MEGAHPATVCAVQTVFPLSSLRRCVYLYPAEGGRALTPTLHNIVLLFPILLVFSDLLVIQKEVKTRWNHTLALLGRRRK